MHTLLRSLDGGSGDDLGGKAGRLQQLVALGVPVPPGFVLPAARFHEAVRALGGAVSSEALLRAPLDPALSAAVREALAALPPGPVAVRSSGLDEDGEQSSFAGQHHTSLNVEGTADVERAIARCWASALLAGVGAYRAASGALAPQGMAVLVQTMVPAETAGVLFTRDPTDGGQRVVVEAVRGLGEALVSGRASPDRYTVDRSTRQIQGAGGCLEPAAVAELAGVGLDLEAKLGEPLDIEWAAAEGRLWLLQARPITALPEPAPPFVWASNNAGELFPRVATPATVWGARLAIDGLLGPIFKLLGVDLASAPMIGLVAGRVYVCVNTFAALIRAVPGFGNANPADLFGGDAAELAEALEKVPPTALPAVKIHLGQALWGGLRLSVAALRQQAVSEATLTGPVITRNNALIQADLSGMNDDELISFILECVKLDQTWVRLVEGIGAGMAALDGVQRLSPRWAGVPGDRFFSGMGGVGSAAMALDLWGLVEAGRRWPRLRQGEPWVELRRGADEAPEGRAFVERFVGWMEAHGHRARGEADLAVPRFRETPDAVLGMVRGLLDAPDEASPVAVHGRALAERLALEARLRVRPGPVRGRLLLGLIRRAQRGLTLRENAKGLLIQRVGRAREALLALGARWVARGRLEVPEDVLYLELEELRQAARDASLALRGRVRRRRRAQRSDEALDPPPVVIGRYDPATAPRPVSAGPVLRGIGVSPGLVEGPARVILAHDDESRVSAGEILVAPFTDPGWAPHFVAAAGLVVDSGGVLSHGSIVARELGLPAVVNAQGATRRIRTGDRIRVDAFRGEVILLGEGELGYPGAAPREAT